MIQVTPLQRANAIEALNVMWPAIRPDQIIERLLDWRCEPDSDGELSTSNVDLDQPPKCGTVACFGGWCEWYSPFRAQMGLDPAEGEADIVALHSLFGACPGVLDEGDSQNIFSVRGYGFPSDNDFEGNDHELVSNRLRWLIENSTVVEGAAS